MSEKIYYYNDALKALWMIMWHDFKIKHYSEEELRQYVGMDSCGGMFFVESVDKLEPQVDDLYYDSSQGIAYLLDKELCKLWHRRIDGEIIMRNDIAFFTPQVEDGK